MLLLRKVTRVEDGPLTGMLRCMVLATGCGQAEIEAFLFDILKIIQVSGHLKLIPSGLIQVL